MSNNQDLQPVSLESSLQDVSTTIRSLANHHQGDSLKLLALLRTLESLHQEVRENSFQAALPDNRQALYSLLKDMESSGGWPYIHRMKLQFFLSQLQSATENDLSLLLTDASKASLEKE